MSLVGFQKSVRMFRKFSEETQRRRGQSELGRDGVAALVALEAVLEGQRWFEGALLEPLSAFTNLLQSGQLPPEFGDYSFGDALLMIEEAHAKRRENDAQRWEFATELDEEVAANLKRLWPPPPAAEGDHGLQLRRFVMDTVQQANPKLVLVCGATHAPELPLAELAARCERLVLSDLDRAGLEALVQRTIPEQHRPQVVLEVYDPTGCYAAFADAALPVIRSAASPHEAEAALVELLESYDVSAGSAGLTSQTTPPDLAVSAMLLSELGQGFRRIIEDELSARGWDSASTPRGALASALTLHSRIVEQHHIQALLRRARSAVLASAVSQVELSRLPSGQEKALGEPTDLLSVERLAERLPRAHEPKHEQTWERRQASPTSKNHSLLTLVEAIVV